MRLPNVLLISIISTEDLKRFRSTLAREFSDHSLNGSKISISSKYAWGFSSSKLHNAIWSRLRRNDYVFFYVQGSIKYWGKIAGKYDSKEVARNLWLKDTHYPGSFNLLTFFDNILNIALSLNHFNDIFGRKTGPIIPNSSVSFMDSDQVRKVISRYGTIEAALGISETRKIEKKTSKPHPIANEIADYDEPPARSRSFVTRFIRDTAKSLKLKEMYNDKCQICGYRLEIGDRAYSEVHHIWPLGEGGRDDYGNMIVLCPNHHAEFDLAVIAIDPDDTKSIIDRNENLIGTLTLQEQHVLDNSNLKYQLHRMKLKR